MREPERLNVVVVGVSGDIGTAIANSLAGEGFRVITTRRKLVPGEGAADERGNPLTYRMDVTDPDGVSSCLRQIEESFGSPFGLVYVAGSTQEAPITLLSMESWRQVIDVNLTGAFVCMRAVAHSMMVAGGGRIILVGSVSGRMGIPGQAAYAASKAGLEGLARVAAVEFGRFGVTCNVVAPGAIDSGIFRTVADKAVRNIVQRTLVRRLGTPAEVAAAVSFLLKPDAAYFTGQTILMDGGISIS